MKKSSLVFIFITALITAVAASGNKNNQTEYVGSENCQACHEEVYETWKSSKHAADFKPEQENTQACNICHSTGLSSTEQTPAEKYVGCEACHGPGEEHAGSGDPAKIVSSKSADVCGRCHNGSRSDDMTALMEYKPGKKLSDINKLKLIPVSTDKTVPFYKDVHPSLTYNMWLASGHAKTPDRNIEISGKKWEGPVTCVACHNPHYSENPSQLIMKAEDLCRECHYQGAVLKGFGAKGIEETRSLHTAIHCTSCHMTESNHLMKMIRPDDPYLSKDRLDSCSDCHEVKDRKMRSGQLQDMEAWYNETMEPVQEYLNFVEEKLKENPDILNAEQVAKLEDVRSNLSIIMNDGSNGVHNLDYALEIMSLAKRHLKKIIKTLDSPIKSGNDS